MVQTNLAKYATNSINEEFGTNINIDRLRVSLISWDTALEGIFIQDYQQDTLIYIEELNTSVLSIRNLMAGSLEFGAIEIDGLNFKLKKYEGETSTNLDIFVAKLDSNKPRTPGNPPFYLSSSDIEIQNSVFRLIDENIENSETLNFKNLNLTARQFQILGPEVTTEIEALSFLSKRGIELSKLGTSFTYTTQQMRFDSLNITTPNSQLVGNLVFDYNREDFADFLNKVNLTANFVDSKVSLDDINTLSQQFGTGKEVLFSASLNGVLNDLNVNEVFLTTENTGIRGDFNFKNLFTKNNPFVLEAGIKNITTSYYELRSLMPEVLGASIPSTFSKLGQFTVRGDATITESSVQTRVNINSSIGSSYVDLTLTDVDQIENARYKGFVSLIDFDLGRFVNDEKLGLASMDVNVEGTGFAQDNLNTEVIGQVYSIEFNKYNYQDLNVSGILKDQLFDGSLVVKDPNFNLDFKGLADFGGAVNNFNFDASVAYADLKKLNFIRDSVSIFKGDVKMDISGSNLDDVVGNISFSNTNYQNINNTYFFEDFKVTSSFGQDSIRTVEINSPDIITGFMRGRFKVNELEKLIRNSIGSIYTNYKPFDISEGQILDFNFKIYNKIVDVFFPQVAFDPNTFIRGNIVADEGDFKLNFKSPRISAFENVFDSIDVKIDNKNPLFNTYVSVSDVKSVYYDLKDFNLINTTLSDTLFFRTEFKGGREFNDSYNLNFYHTFNAQNRSVIGLKRSDVNFKGNTWVLNKDGDRKNKVIISRSLDSIQIEEIVMNNDNREQIRLRGELADSTYKDLQLDFKIVSLNKITPSIDSLKLQGEINGTLNILQKDDIYLPSCNLQISDFGVNDIALGELSIGIVGNRDLTEYVVNSQISDDGVEKFSLLGNFNNRNDIPDADLMANFNNFSLEPFSPLGEGIITNIRGMLNGAAQIKGDLRNPNISGLLNLNDAGIAIPYLNVDYSFGPNSRVRLYNQTFDFENIELTDVTMNTSAELDGTIKHQFWDDWTLDLDVNTNNNRFLILNTPFEEEVLYYGTGYLNGEGRIFGPTRALTIKVYGETAEGTSLKIPLSDVASIGDYSFINFIEKKDQQTFEIEKTLQDYEGLELNFDLDVTPDAEVEIVVDQKTGSSLKGTGEGILLIRINTKGTFNMFGDFVVVTGTYNYRFGGVIDKSFTVKPGGSIVWDGTPLAAQLNMEAVYSLNANPAPLLDNSGVTRRIPTDVVVQLTGELERPTIDFNIEFPGTSSIVQSELEYKLQDPTVEERNAFFLLAQGTFVDEGSGLNQQAVTGNLIQTASGLVNSLLGGGNDKFDFGFSLEQSTLDASQIETENRLGVTVSTRISDRVLFNGRFGVPVGGVSETVVAGDVEVQVLLNEEGTLRAKIFNRENEIQQFLADQTGYTQGIGLSYEVDFSTFNELLRKVFKPKEKSETSKLKAEKSKATMGRDSLIKFYQKPKTNLLKK
ncbi:translocation/assembly module TamB domain-containing protein [Muriicola soli]|uniref:translocation/assembly module TamB domain-containing protein n=1 Tax=Muriicola soli TaxID=2507538 RepID=UPI001FEC321E|nr:translocation/assembly module TamB domain-containing protein [Muriicola soli]